MKRLLRWIENKFPFFDGVYQMWLGSQRDRDALNQLVRDNGLLERTNSSGWYYTMGELGLYNWSTGASLRRWEKVTCNFLGNVVGLDLRGIKITNADALGDLQNLTLFQSDPILSGAMGDFYREVLKADYDNLPSEINGYTKKKLELEEFTVIEYSKSRCFFRHVHPAQFSSEYIEENLLFDVVARHTHEATIKMNEKIAQFQFTSKPTVKP